ncbi:MAG: SPOR domain-containing protein [Nitrosomonadaceae bacterium]|jgi:cell division protein FtsN|nr:SPOR domain-containing protein [Nitrosomonadaceae bacterium]
MSRDYKSPSRSNSRKKGSNLFLGLFIGYVLGLVSAIGVWMYIHQAPSPFIQNEKPEVSTKIEPSKNGNIALKEMLILDNSEDQAKDPNEKTRFEFYEMLPGNEEPVTEIELQKAAEQPILKDKYYLQVGSFKDTEDAENLKAKIAMLGMEAYVQSADLSEKGMWHRVRVGPFTKIDTIKKTRSSLLQSGIKANLIKIHAKTQ